jgi:hypothetical protein
MWTFIHLRGIGWYLESGLQHMQDLENDKFNSLELGSGDLFEGEALAGLDGKACERLITQNKKKARKVNDALNSNHEI